MEEFMDHNSIIFLLGSSCIMLVLFFIIRCRDCENDEIQEHQNQKNKTPKKQTYLPDSLNYSDLVDSIKIFHYRHEKLLDYDLLKIRAMYLLDYLNKKKDELLNSNDFRLILYYTVKERIIGRQKYIDGNKVYDKISLMGIYPTPYPEHYSEVFQNKNCMKINFLQGNSKLFCIEVNFKT